MTNDIDAIRQRTDRLAQMLSRSGDHPAAISERAWELATGDVPALLAKVDELTAQVAGRDKAIHDHLDRITRLELLVAGLEQQCNEQMHQLTAANLVAVDRCDHNAGLDVECRPCLVETYGQREAGVAR